MQDDILKIISDYLDIPVSDLSPERTLVDLGVDSIDFFEMLYEIEEQLGIRVAGDPIQLRKEIHSIADVIRLASELGQQDSASREVRL